MKKILLLSDAHYNNRSNGPMNTLRGFLEYIPEDYLITAVISDDDVLDIDVNTNAVVIKRKLTVNMFRKTFLSTSFSLYKVDKTIENIIMQWSDKDPILLWTSTLNVYSYLFKNKRVYMNLTDLPTIAMRQYIRETSNVFKKAYYLKELLYGKYYEKIIPLVYEGIILVNNKETDIANRNNNTDKYLCVPVVYKRANEIKKAKASADSSINLVFVGNMSFTPNEDGLNLFYNSIFKNLGSNYRLHLIGKGTEKLFAGDLRVKQYGFVDDMASIISKMDFGICFMKNGGGMKNKIFDYMKYGIPCIINNHVNEYNTVDSDYIYVANDVQDFIKASSIKGLNPVEIKRSIERYEVSNVARDFWKLFD